VSNAPAVLRDGGESQRLPGLPKFESQSGAGPASESNRAEPFGVGIHPIALDSELLSQLLRIEQAAGARSARNDLGDALRNRIELVDVERDETSLSRAEERNLARDQGRKS
jgi:hypothetical protein